MKKLLTSGIFPLFGKILFFLTPFLSSALPESSCKNSFAPGSLREARAKAAERAGPKDAYRPKFRDITEEIRLSPSWSGKRPQSVASLTAFLPESVSFIDHRLRVSEGQSFVKFGPTNQRAASLILRARYESQGKILETNVTLRKTGLAGNLESKRKWLIGPKSQAAILFLHGGGTKTTGGHVAETLINHFHKHNISAMGMDLPWHGEGPRAFMGSLDQEIMALSDFAKKYIHPGVPLFVWGHSWGGSLAHRLMQISGEKKRGFFHRNLRGLVISSPALDPAPGRPFNEKRRALAARRLSALDKEDQIPPGEKDFLLQMVADGKTSPVGEFFAGFTIAQLDDSFPSHSGKSYIPALMLVGKGDQLVYLGFEELFHKYYSPLENVEAHYLDKLPLLMSSDKSRKEMTGHLLGDYVSEEDGKTPVHFKLGYDFISRLAGLSETEKKAKPFVLANSLLDILQLWANDLGFREWAREAEIIEIFKTQGYKKTLEEKIAAEKLMKSEMGKLAPKTKLAALLKDFIGQGRAPASSSKQPALFEAQERVRMFEAFFMNDKQARELISSFIKAESREEAYEAAGDLLQSSVFNNLSQAADNFTKKNSRDSLESLKEKYRYISDQDIDRFFPIREKLKSLEQKLTDSYIPSAEDYRQAAYLNLDEAEIERRIAWIEENIKKRELVLKKKHRLSGEISQLKRDLTANLERIHHYISQIKALFEKAPVDPPAALKEDYKNSYEELSRLYKLSEELMDKLEEASFSLLSRGALADSHLSEVFSPHREIIESFSAKYTLFVENRSKLRQKLINLARAGGLNASLQEAATAIYGEAGLYKLTDSLSLQLAAMEAERIKLAREQARLIADYNKWIPHEPLSRVEIAPVMDVLNIRDLDERSLEKYTSQILRVLRSWNQNGSEIPPSPPE